MAVVWVSMSQSTFCVAVGMAITVCMCVCVCTYVRTYVCLFLCSWWRCSAAIRATVLLHNCVLIVTEQLTRPCLCQFVFMLVLCNTAWGRWWVFGDSSTLDCFCCLSQQVTAKQKHPTDTRKCTFMTGNRSCLCKTPAGEIYSFWLTCWRNYKDPGGSDGKTTDTRTRRSSGDDNGEAGQQLRRRGNRPLLPSLILCTCAPRGIR